jgi:hypothetical protein
MNKQNETQKNNDWMKTTEVILTELFLLTTNSIKEIYFGFKNRTIPIFHIFAWCLCFFIATKMRWDILLFEKLHIGFLYPYKYYKLYTFMGLNCGFIFYGVFRHYRIKKLLKYLTQCFEDAGLRTFTGKLPKFVSDTPLDDTVYEMRFYTNGTPIKKFIEAKESIESTFFVIDDIYQDFNNHQLVVIRYSTRDLSQNISADEMPTLEEGHFPVGMSRSGVVTGSLSETPHLLVGGSTSKGKSSFLRYFITYLLLNNRRLEVVHIDLKEGAEAHMFEGCERHTGIDNPSEAATKLAKLEDVITKRMRFLKENSAVSYEIFKRMNPSKIKWTEDVRSMSQMNRIIIIIDEAAMLFMASAMSPGQTSINAKASAQRIGARGRAAGVHLVVATQRPDAYSVDMNIKTHMSGRLCFHMSDNHSSQTILDSGRATKILPLKGRAIWSENGTMSEIQVPYLSPEKAKEKLMKAGILKTQALSNEAEKAPDEES